jgi:hypothetical protein
MAAAAANDHMKLHPFLWMGCWNTVGSARNAVLDAIRENSIVNFVLAGDNVYPLEDKSEKKEGEKKKKVHSPEVFNEGVARLAETKRILTSALGNHNVEEAAMEAHQKAYFKITGSNYFYLLFNDAALLILDTNIMDNVAKVDEMCDFLRTALTTGIPSGMPYYLVQHEPFASYKKAKDPVLKNGDKVLRILAMRPPVAILCADTHNYQEGTISVDGVNIRQIVVGTGGASHDYFDLTGKEPLRIDKPVESAAPAAAAAAAAAAPTEILYTIDPGSSLPYYGNYGYYQMNGIGAGQFIPVLPWATTGGRRSRRHRAYKGRARTVNNTRRRRRSHARK